jgi:hypothetical protein
MAAPRCPYCHDAAGSPAVVCLSCAAIAHEACWGEGGGACAACRAAASAPVEGATDRALVAAARRWRLRWLYLRGYLALLLADGEVGPGERRALREVATRLELPWLPDELRGCDLSRLAREVRAPDVQAALFRDLARAAGLDRAWSQSEVRIIKCLAAAWRQPLPVLPGVDWDAVGPASAAELRAQDGVALGAAASPDDGLAPPPAAVGGVQPAPGIEVVPAALLPLSLVAALPAGLTWLAVARGFGPDRGPGWWIPAASTALALLPLAIVLASSLRAAWWLRRPARSIRELCAGEAVARCGAVEAAAACLHAPFTGTPCVYWRARRTRRWTTRPDRRGKRRWSRVLLDRDCATSFVLRDGAGAVLVLGAVRPAPLGPSWSRVEREEDPWGEDRRVEEAEDRLDAGRVVWVAGRVRRATDPRLLADLPPDVRRDVVVVPVALASSERPLADGVGCLWPALAGCALGAALLVYSLARALA